MGRFLLSHRRAGNKAAHQHSANQQHLHDALHKHIAPIAQIHRAHQPDAHHHRHLAIVDGDHQELSGLAGRMHPELILEPAIAHFNALAHPLGSVEADRTRLHAHDGSGQTLQCQVTDDSGKPLADVRCFLYIMADRSRHQLVQVTDKAGVCQFEFSASAEPVTAVAFPWNGYWPMIEKNVSSVLQLRCPKLPQADNSAGWWHQTGGFSRYAATRGRGIRVGVIDTGIGPNTNLGHIHNLGAIIDAAWQEHGGQDVQGHGSHVCGIIGARPQKNSEYGGLAPASRIASLRVFPESGGAHQGDIALAIWEMAHEQKCHLINMSLGTPSMSQIEHDAIQDAAEQGALTIISAGNICSAIEYPAAFGEAVAVSAIGKKGWGPEGSLAASRWPDGSNRIASDPYYLANFSCTGPEMDIAGPGVGIISTMPGNSKTAAYGALDGTSMAAPFVTGMMAARLSRNSDYKSMQRGRERTEFARAMALRMGKDIALATEMQGQGLIHFRP